MMSEQHPGDLWPFVPEFEKQYTPGQNLDFWREAEAFFAPLSALVEHSPNEACKRPSTPWRTAWPNR